MYLQTIRAGVPTIPAKLHQEGRGAWAWTFDTSQLQASPQRTPAYTTRNGLRLRVPLPSKASAQRKSHDSEEPKKGKVRGAILTIYKASLSAP